VNLREKAINGLVWSVFQKWGRATISTVAFIALARLLPPEAFGLVALATVVTAFIEILLDQGFSAAIVQRVDLEREHLDTAFWISVLIGILLTFGTIAVSGVAAGFFEEPELAPVLRWLSVSFVFVALSSTQTAILQRELRFKSLAARSTIAALAGAVVGVSMAIAGFGVWSLVGQNLIRALAGVIVLWRASTWRPRLKVSKTHYKELFTFGASVTGNNLLHALTRRSDDFLIGYFLGPTMLGYYTVGYRLLLVTMRLVTGIVNSVAFPTFSRIQQNRKRMRRAFYEVTQYTSLLAFPIFIGLAALAPVLVPALFGEKWAPSIPIMQILALIGILQSVLVFNGSVMRASGKPSWQFGIMLMTAVCSVIGFLIAVRWGIVAVAASFVIVGYLLAPISFAAMRKLIQIDFRTYLGHFVAPLSASFIMVAVIWGLNYLFAQQALNLYLQLTIYVAAGALTYLLVIVLTARSVSRQVLELTSLAFPSWRLRMNRYIRLLGGH
jgi:PST family polysaccharide transporter